MNPLGDDTGLLALFGACTAIVLLAALRLRAGRRPIVASTLVGLLCGMLIYAALAVLSLLAHGTGGYDLGWWLLLVGAGLVPAGVVGLVEGFAASLIIRLLATRRPSTRSR